MKQCRVPFIKLSCVWPTCFIVILRVYVFFFEIAVEFSMKMCTANVKF